MGHHTPNTNRFLSIVEFISALLEERRGKLQHDEHSMVSNWVNSWCNIVAQRFHVSKYRTIADHLKKLEQRRKTLETLKDTSTLTYLDKCLLGCSDTVGPPRKGRGEPRMFQRFMVRMFKCYYAYDVQLTVNGVPMADAVHKASGVRHRSKASRPLFCPEDEARALEQAAYDKRKEAARAALVAKTLARLAKKKRAKEHQQTVPPAPVYPGLQDLRQDHKTYALAEARRSYDSQLEDLNVERRAKEAKLVSISARQMSAIVKAEKQVMESQPFDKYAKTMGLRGYAEMLLMLAAPFEVKRGQIRRAHEAARARNEHRFKVEEQAMFEAFKQRKQEINKMF